jgi:hypothetical protein
LARSVGFLADGGVAHGVRGLVTNVARL